MYRRATLIHFAGGISIIVTVTVIVIVIVISIIVIMNDDGNYDDTVIAGGDQFEIL